MEATEHEASDVTIGIRLQLLRKQQGLSFQKVSEETHISFSNLTAIEAENFDQLPADIFVRGLVNIYGNYLGLDGAETARLFLKERDQRQPRGKKNRSAKQSHSLAPKKLAEPSHISSATVAGILLLLIVVTFSAFCVYTGWNPFAYFLNQGQQATPPLTGAVTPESENEQAATDNHPITTTTPTTLTTQVQESAASSAVQQNDNAGLNTPDARPDH